MLDTKFVIGSINRYWKVITGRDLYKSTLPFVIQKLESLCGWFNYQQSYRPHRLVRFVPKTHGVVAILVVHNPTDDLVEPFAT